LGPRVRLFDVEKVRELGLERRETVWSLSIMCVKKLKGVWASMRRMHEFLCLKIV